LIKCFLANVHAFTVLGLEAQATAFSSGENGVVNYLAKLPQTNTPTNVTSRDPGVTELDSVQRMEAMNPQASPFVPRCWIHTHPRWRAFMSATDIFQLYLCACQFHLSFGIVISPRVKGLKVLCVHLTEIGFTEGRRFCQEQQKQKSM